MGINLDEMLTMMIHNHRDVSAVMELDDGIVDSSDGCHHSATLEIDYSTPEVFDGVENDEGVVMSSSDFQEDKVFHLYTQNGYRTDSEKVTIGITHNDEIVVMHGNDEPLVFNSTEQVDEQVAILLNEDPVLDDEDDWEWEC